MDQGQPDTKRPRLSTGSSSWSAGGTHHGVSLLHPTPSPTASQIPHHPPPTQYQPSPHPYARAPGPGDPHPAHPHGLSHPPPPPPSQQTPIDDRRHHEPERYPPMQEHRQPPHSPVHPTHPAFPGYPPPREPMVKADPSDDNLPQLRRNHSTGTGTDTMTPGTPHSAIPPQSYAEDKRHMSFDSGPPQPPMYRQPSYPPQTPLPHPQYDYPPSYVPQHADMYQIQISTSGKRKAQRASQACDSCRQLKAKCDELKPCKSCKEKKVECKYREAVPKQQDKVAADILDILMYLRNEFSGFNERLTGVERALRRAVPSIDLHADPMQEDDNHHPGSPDSAVPMAEDRYTSSPGENMTAGETLTGGESMSGNQPPIGSLEARNITRNMEDEAEPEPGPHVRPGVPAIPLNHTTLAALLLKWRSIEKLVRPYLDAEKVKFVDEFPIRQEERRGLLRVWGRGEGLDSSRKEGFHDLGMMEVHDDYSDAGAPSPADCWGGIGSSPAPFDSGPAIYGVRSLDFSEAVVWKFVRSYQENIQNMHPLIIPVELNAMVKLFLDGIQQSLGKQSKSGGVAKFVGMVPPMAAPQVETGGKRKRASPAPPNDLDQPSSVPMKPAKPSFQRSINNALVLLVLALGKICLHKDKRIPDVVPVNEPAQSPLVRNGNPAVPASPILQNSPPSYGSGLSSPKESTERPGPSRRASFQGGNPTSAKSGTSMRRNLDAIPGLDYFAYATDILGGQLAGTSLRHIHAHILAGLYHGQLGRVMESYAYIKEAGWALQIKMRPSLDRFKKLQENMPFDLHAVTEKSDNQLVFAFWTCLQLESDIIAELPLPQSHILAFEEIMPYPNVDLAKTLGFQEEVLQSYLAQLYLRKSLNQIHQMLYNPENPALQAQSGTPAENIIEYIQTSLDMRFVPPGFKFEHSDPPARDILAARLRAKYWGAQVITYRPFIRQILESNHKNISIESSMPLSGEYRGDTAMPDARPADEIPQDMINNAARGIRGLIESTRAFHAVEDRRFIITNVFGTAHAQWGNLLTLAAVFKDPTLGRFIDEPTLRDLFQRTIAFFRVISQPSSALAIDMRILEGLERELWRKPNNIDPDGYPGSSFSSATSSGPPMPPMTPLPGPSGPPGPHAPTMRAPGPPPPITHIEGMVSTLPPMQHHPQHHPHHHPS